MFFCFLYNQYFIILWFIFINIPFNYIYTILFNACYNKRKINEGILIGKDINVDIVQVYNNKVKLGITAPDNVKIMRKELLNFEEYECIDKIK